MSAFTLTRRAALTGLGACAVGGFDETPAREIALNRPSSHALACAGVIVLQADGWPAYLASSDNGVLGRPFFESSPFRVASISKLVTAIGFLRLLESRAIGLDDDAASWLGPAFRHPVHPRRPITPRRLLSHTSGLRNGADFPVPAGESLTLRLQRAAGEPDFGGWFALPETPPAWFSYSDTNSAVLAQLIEAVSGQRFDQFMRTNVFASDHRLSAGYNWSGVPQRQRNRAWPGLRLTDGVWTPQVDAAPPPEPEIALYAGEAAQAPSPDHLPLAENGFAFAPHGGLRMSLAQLALIGQAMAGGHDDIGLEHLARAARRLRRRPAWRYDPNAPNGDTANGFFQSYGLGLQRLIGVSGPGFGDALFGAQSHEWVGHAGDAYGWIAGLWWNTRTRAVVAYAINGVPEEGRIPGRRSAFMAVEEELVDEALAALSG